MELSQVLIVILLCIGAFQGIVYGVILFRSTTQNKLANQILGTILFFLSYRLIIQTMRLFSLGHYDIWYYFMLDLSWINGALLYFYVKAHVTSSPTLNKKDWIHFIPITVQIICSVFVRLQNLYWDGTRESLSWLGYWGYVVWMNLPTIYIIASILIIAYAYKAQGVIKNAIDQNRYPPEKLVWIKRIVLAFQVYFSLVLVVLVADLIAFNFREIRWYFYFTRYYYYPFFIGIAALTYWIGLEGFKRKDQKEVKPSPTLSPDQKTQLEQIAVTLEESMKKEKLFKDPELSLSSLAESIHVKPYQLSKCFKEVLDTKFNDYVNQLRIEEVKASLRKPSSSQFTLLSLAMDAGFNSKSSFNRAVKKHLGISPSELRETL